MDAPFEEMKGQPIGQGSKIGIWASFEMDDWLSITSIVLGVHIWIQSRYTAVFS